MEKSYLIYIYIFISRLFSYDGMLGKYPNNHINNINIGKQSMFWFQIQSQLCDFKPDFVKQCWWVPVMKAPGVKWCSRMSTSSNWLEINFTPSKGPKYYTKTHLCVPQVVFTYSSIQILSEDFGSQVGTRFYRSSHILASWTDDIQDLLDMRDLFRLCCR